jgi:hypothetical protein
MKQDETKKNYIADIAKVCERSNKTLFAAELNSVNSVQPAKRGG